MTRIGQRTRASFVEALFHAKFFLGMAVKYGKELQEAPEHFAVRLGSIAVFLQAIRLIRSEIEE